MTVPSFIHRLSWAVAAALFLGLLGSLAALDQIPVVVRGFVAAIALLTAWRSEAGLVTAAVLIPVATWMGRTWDGGVAWPEAVAVAVLAGHAARQTVVRTRHPADALTTAIHVMVAVVASSLAVQLAVLRSTIGDAAMADVLTGLATGGYFIGNSGLEGLDAAMRLIEGLLLAAAGIEVVRTRRQAARPILVAVVAGAAAAAFLNVWRIWTASLRLDEPFKAFLRHLATLRYNVHYGDINAAGSYFLMTLLPAAGLVRAVSVWRWLLPAGLIAISLVLSGSRGALVAGGIAVASAWWTRRSRPPAAPAGRRVRLILPLALVIAAGGAGAAYLMLQRNPTPAATALIVRGEYTRISLAMLATRPVFGIGPGQYPVRLPEFATPRLVAIYPVLNENAHNNFLQILAELGIAGFASFLAVLGIAFARLRQLVASGQSTLAESGAFAGLLGFTLTWLAGHPLLVDAPAFSFWILFGAMAGAATVAMEGHRAAEVAVRRRVRPWATGLIALLILSVPFRAERELGAANLEHIGIGLSQWQPEKDGVEFRTAGVSSIVFVPSYARFVEIPLRAVEGQTVVRVALSLDGRPADVVAVRSDAWYPLRLPIPPQRQARQFLALELRVVDGSSGDLLMIGKVRPNGL